MFCPPYPKGSESRGAYPTLRAYESWFSANSCDIAAGVVQITNASTPPMQALTHAGVASRSTPGLSRGPTRIDAVVDTERAAVATAKRSSSSRPDSFCVGSP